MRNKLKAILTRLCITQADFAKAVGVSEAQMCRMCNAEKLRNYHRFLIEQAAISEPDNGLATVVRSWLAGNKLPPQQKTDKQKHYDSTIDAMQQGERVYFRAPYDLPYLKKICKHNFTIKPRVDGVWVAKVK